MFSTIRLIVHTLSQTLRERLDRTIARAARRKVKVRIGIDIRPFYEPLTGIGWYLYHLVHEFAKHDDVELYLFGDARVTDEGPRLHAELPANARVCIFDMTGRGRVSGKLRALTAAAYVAWMKLIDCDVMFAANYFLPRLHSAVARRRVIAIHDLTYKRFPELLQKETLDNLEALMTREIAMADAIVCVSESTRRDLLRYYAVDPSRAIAILSGVAAPVAPRLAEGLPPRYLLFVSTIEPRKNLGVLLDAFERLRARGAYDGELVVVGKIGWKSESLVPRLRGAGVRHLDYLGAGELATVYRNAELFVFPSIYEGFGFPLLEAMLHGVPAIAAKSSSLPEVGGDAALYFPPHDARALESLIERVTSDAALRADLVARGTKRVAQFRWDDAAAKTLAVLRRVAE
jgi:glycosyltransferase involved in cell wall biosynthesis